MGGAGNDGASCTQATWASCPIYLDSSLGGMDATVDGQNRPGALSMVNAIAPATLDTCLGIGDNEEILLGCGHGTSYSGPQVGGGAIQLKDFMLTNGHTAVSIEGRLYVMLQAMTDRATGTSTTTNSGFDDLWGGGRFQLRGLRDNEALWWDTWSTILTDGLEFESVVNGGSFVPSGTGQFKAYTMVFEEDDDPIANIDLKLFDLGCGAGATKLREDVSFDVKSMVRIGSSAAGQLLCTRLEAVHVPGSFPFSRRVHVFRYFSDDTSMR